MNIRLLTLIAFLATTAQGASAAALEVSVKGIKNHTGDLLIAIYNSEATFQKDAHKNIIIPATSNTVEFTVDGLEVGEFAIMLFHDIDADMKLKTNLVGMPREPWGASLQGKTLRGPPEWKDVSFVVTESGTELEIVLN